MFLDWYYYDFWRSCDTEDWSNDAENTEINYSLTEITLEKVNIICILYLHNMFCIYTINNCIFDQINAALVSRRGIKKIIYKYI